jgi:hypothetical protein
MRSLTSFRSAADMVRRRPRRAWRRTDAEAGSAFRAAPLLNSGKSR